MPFGLTNAPTVFMDLNLVVEVDIGRQLLKDFVAFQPSVFHRGTDAVAVEN